ncbi:hypothetical protein [Vagococcus xieshaowenii]|uniref:Uncharacterized protein n=1 Tax=Vagococcus xieshaowenii TaxID=2562451 RepID=A0AAJ5EHG5_9ENTE|nr:hypothetical protein [Vagococcus xieshaowenii]QCA29223.1 hypothetical protein E4Z98_07795 [Vagococcus xieshaowenii]TFZ43264.1 hypothetical protein E4031_00650 [Vagococcus xieshaowenii]
MVRILLIFLMIMLVIIGLVLKTKIPAITKIASNEQAKIKLTQLFKQLVNALMILAVVGLLFVYLNTKVSALLYIAIIMLTSAYFSIMLAKQIEAK